ncbi:hypothetical protein L1987_57304 [Smallanthus sonchifolius]|uniref:Uncharacterized protein n=1 Tax=Smallanthus sonchifolius TaxID=185202 RepID=A0ACB9DCG5_9ASTR|nr:hypothetical protein L1987_57304 [Smallanthus sonchifolius]
MNCALMRQVQTHAFLWRFSFHRLLRNRYEISGKGSREIRWIGDSFLLRRFRLLKQEGKIPMFVKVDLDKWVDEYEQDEKET